MPSLRHSVSCGTEAKVLLGCLPADNRDTEGIAGQDAADAPAVSRMRCHLYTGENKGRAAGVLLRDLCDASISTVG
jgi:hypothetical protein